MFCIQIPRAYQYSYHEKKMLVLFFFSALLNVHKASADVRVVHGGDKGRKMGISNLLNWDLILIYVRER